MTRDTATLDKAFKLTAAILTLATAQLAHAGPYILSGTDADDHGYTDGTSNIEGWLYMQKALENIAGSSTLTNTHKEVLSLGSDAGTQAGQAAASAFAFSALASSGWTFVQVSDISGLSSSDFASTLASASIVMLDSGGNVFGGLGDDEETVLTANAGTINSFVGGGGGLFSQAGAYGWLSAIVPSLTVNDVFDEDLTLTDAGKAAFPGLSDADLSAGPYHEYFTDIGPIPVLATGESGALNVVIGAAGGSFTNPIPVATAVPEPSTYALLAIGLLGVGRMVRRRS